MTMFSSRLIATLAIAITTPPIAAQSNDVINRMMEEGMENSQAWPLAQTLMDSVGPRLTGSEGYAAAGSWIEEMYARWGIEARREDYGTWNGWERGFTHLDLLTPRLRTLEATLLAWSAGTDGPVEGEVVLVPEVRSEAEFNEWLDGVGGKFVLVDYAEPSCRPDQEWERWATPETHDRIKAQREAGERDFFARYRNYGIRRLQQLASRLEEHGAAGWISTNWSGGWGVNKVFGAPSDGMPAVDVSCEDYGLLFRLADANQGPTIRLNATSQVTGEQKAFNVVGVIPGTELPDEYVLLSAHLDSWDGASGATDNGTGTVMMMEAMRILKTAYPNPKRTIMVGHWGGEELGLVGSGAFAEDHPDVIRGMQATFNQDNGTWRIDYIRMQGFTQAGAFFQRWFRSIPASITRGIELDIPGVPESGGSDHMSFICRGVPGFRLQSSYPEYRQYTWHTNRDTFDKIVFDDLKNNATLAAMLAYLASEESERIPRDRRALPSDTRTGRPGEWPGCPSVRRTPN
jgi:carboxypeptidase Q